jgi:Kef-type K+ transport system membrane component KefB
MEQMAMEWLASLHFQSLPTLAKAAITMMIIVGVPPLARRVRIPELVGLLVFGIILAPQVLNISGTDHPVIGFFAQLGKLMLMFAAGLEIDMDLFRKARNRSLTFGFITTIVPQVLGTAFALAFGYPMIPAIVIGSLLASHTLLALPIVLRLGAVGLEPVVVTIGATIVSDMASLIVFGICVSTYTTGFSLSGFAWQILEIAIFVPFILVGVSRAGAWTLGKLRDNEEGYFVTMLAIMIVASLLADVINLPDIVGAFLAGVSVNAAVADHPAKEKLNFLGKSLFIPVFFLVTGFLIDPVPFVQAILGNFWLVLGLIASLIVAKGIAAFVAGSAFGYPREAKLTMWAMSLPQVAATLAATLVGYATLNQAGVRLLDERMLNAVLVMLVVTSILGPVLTEVFTPGLIKREADLNAALRRSRPALH